MNKFFRKILKFLSKGANRAKEAMKPLSLADKVVALAKKEIGVEEENGSNCGVRVNQYKSATSLNSKKSWPWCAAFVCWLYREGMEGGSYTFSRPKTAGAWDFENWARKQDNSIITKKPHKNDICAGDIVIFTFSHIGLAISRPDEKGYVTTIEGNTDSSGSREGGGVFQKKRHVSKIRSRIRAMD
tara:strand:- start:1254 stop:1811 length:558 start_codon:yes stop_codon:yes gene_type:complete